MQNMGTHKTTEMLYLHLFAKVFNKGLPHKCTLFDSTHSKHVLKRGQNKAVCHLISTLVGTQLTQETQFIINTSIYSIYKETSQTVRDE